MITVVLFYLVQTRICTMYIYSVISSCFIDIDMKLSPKTLTWYDYPTTVHSVLFSLLLYDNFLCVQVIKSGKIHLAGKQVLMLD